MKKYTIISILFLFFYGNVFAQIGNGYCIQFDGTNDVQISVNSSLNQSGSLTVEGWFLTNKVGLQHIVDKYHLDDSGYRFLINEQNVPAFNLGPYNGGFGQVADFQNPIEVGKWYHFAVTYNKDTDSLKLYIDGILRDAKKCGGCGSTIPNNEILRFSGRSQSGAFKLDGMLDEVRIWKVARSKEQIVKTMNDTLGLEYYMSSDSGLISYWRFDEGTGDTVYDLTANHNNGVIQGDAKFIKCSNSSPLEFSNADTIFFDDFDNLDNWQIVNGSWVIRNGVLSSIKPGEPFDQIILNRLFNYDSLIVTVKCRFDSNISYGDLGMGFWSDKNNNIAIWHSVSGYYHIGYTLNGRWHHEKNSLDKKDVILGEWFKITECLFNKEIKVYHNNEKTLEYLNNTSLSHENMRVILSSNWGPTASFDSLFVIISHFSNYTVPIELEYFSISREGKEIILSWKTLSEKSNMGFEIQRRMNANWMTIGFIKGQGTALRPHLYKYYDKILPSWNSVAKIHYRLKQINLDGTFSFSKEKIAFMREMIIRREINNFPNPFNSSTTICYFTDKPTKVKMLIYNTNGKMVRKMSAFQNSAGKHSFIWDGKDNMGRSVGSGLYIYKVIFNNRSLENKMLLIK